MKNLSRNIRKITQASLLSAALTAPAFAVNAPLIGDPPEQYSTPGVACQHTSFAQAINLGATWGQRRVYNPNEIGSMRTYFVACPIVVGSNGLSAFNSDANGNDVEIYIYKDTPAANAVTCFIQRIDNSTSTAANPNGDVLSISGTTGPNPINPGGKIYLITINDIIENAPNNWQVRQEYLQAVCALQPKTGVNSYNLDYDGYFRP